jgi:hypothetical protein
VSVGFLAVLETRWPEDMLVVHLCLSELMFTGVKLSPIKERASRQRRLAKLRFSSRSNSPGFSMTTVLEDVRVRSDHTAVGNVQFE